MKKNAQKPTFDCHGLTYYEVEDKLPNWILTNQNRLPIDVITGNSDEMKKLCTKIAEELDFQHFTPMHNHGMITILS